MKIYLEICKIQLRENSNADITVDQVVSYIKYSSSVWGNIKGVIFF